MKISIPIPLLIAAWPFDGRAIDTMTPSEYPPFSITVWAVNSSAVSVVALTIIEPFSLPIFEPNSRAVSVMKDAIFIVPFGPVVEDL